MASQVPAPLRFRTLRLSDFRNLREAAFELASRLNVISGANGLGKTSVVEALYVVATTRSFRTDHLADLVRSGAAQAAVAACVAEAGLERAQRAVIAPRGRSFAIDERRSARAADHALRTPLVVFHPGDLDLAQGSPAARRGLLDRVALHLDPGRSVARMRFLRAARARQAALLERGVRAPELDAFEALMADEGVSFQMAREMAAERVGRALAPAFQRVSAPGLRLEAALRPGGTTDVALFRRELEARRGQDLRRGSASFGPHRDELELTLEGRPARTHASQGQQRLLALALKLAELEAIRDARGIHPVLLLDDVSSELDPDRTGAVYRLLRETESQVFVTTTRPELLPTPDLGPEERADFHLPLGRSE